jgi:phage gp29-like protein
VLDMLEKLYSEAIAALPAGTNLEVLQPARDYDFIPGFNYFDDQMSRLYTGGDLSTGHAGGKGNMGATAQHGQTEDELVASIARSLFLIFNQQVIRPLVDLNFGKQQRYPYAALPEEDMSEQYMNRVSSVFEKKIMVPISKAQFYDQTGFLPPKDDADILIPSDAPAMPTLGFSEGGGSVNFQEGSATPSNSLIPQTTAATHTRRSTTKSRHSVEKRLSELQRSMRTTPDS